MSRKPRILITNDDGIHALGIKHLWRPLAEFADVYVVAPTIEMSGAGLGVTLRDPLLITPVSWEKETPAWKVNGTPADCVAMALRVILKDPPDLIVSGINKGMNAGRVVLYSGTVGGVIEGILRDIPGIAFSCVDFDNPTFSSAERYIAPIVQHVLDQPLPKGTLLNVNFPQEIRGVKFASQGKGFWRESPEPRTHPEGHTYYWRGGQWIEASEEEDSDISLLQQGFATVVPIHIAELTDRKVLAERKEAFDQAFETPSLISSEK